MFVFRALASGSSGNAFLLRTDRANVLFDAGLKPPALAKALSAENVALRDLDAVLISHEHRDHCLAAQELALNFNVSICANSQVLRAIGLQAASQAHVVEVDRDYEFGDVVIRTFPVAHDAVSPVGFFVRTQDRCITIATDLGNSTAAVTEVVELSNLVVLEANHDTEMLHRGRYPYHLRKRVSGPMGHLSNSQAADMLVRHVKCEEVHVWLAHLSKENNTPALAKRTVRHALNRVGLSSTPVDVASRDRPSLRWTGEARPHQLSLFASTESG